MADETEKVDIIRAWKDEEYRNSLTPEQLAQIPANPAGDVELDEAELDDVSGGHSTFHAATTHRAPLLP